MLHEAGVQFEVCPAEIDESVGPGETPLLAVTRLALEKALVVRARVAPGSVVLGADTAVVCDGLMLGKPAGFDDALWMLDLLSGRAHRVITGWALVSDRAERAISGASASLVRMRELGRREAIAYASSTEPYDKAGAYAAQGEGRRLIAAVIGGLDNVIGLPVGPVCDALARVGILPRNR